MSTCMQRQVISGNQRTREFAPHVGRGEQVGQRVRECEGAVEPILMREAISMQRGRAISMQWGAVEAILSRGEVEEMREGNPHAMREGDPHAIRRTHLSRREVAGRIGREGTRAEQLQQPLLVRCRYPSGRIVRCGHERR